MSVFTEMESTANSSFFNSDEYYDNNTTDNDTVGVKLTRHFDRDRLREVVQRLNGTLHHDGDEYSYYTDYYDYDDGVMANVSMVTEEGGGGGGLTEEFK